MFVVLPVLDISIEDTLIRATPFLLAGLAVAVPARAFDGAALLVSVPQGGHINKIIDTLVQAGASVRASTLVGSHATRYTVTADGARPVGR